MSTFSLTVVTPSGVAFDGDADQIIVRTVNGDIGILSGHANYVAALAIGALTVTIGDKKRVAAIAGGMIKVDNDKTTILTNTCEWADEIDIERAKRAAERAKQYLESPTELHTEEVAMVKLQRAMNRLEIASKKMDWMK